MKVTAISLLCSALLVTANPVEQLDERDGHLEKRRNFEGTANGGADLLNCRRGPGTGYPVVTKYGQGAKLNIRCQTGGENIDGDSIWNLVDRFWFWEADCYVADRYTKTGYYWIPGVPHC